METNGIRPLFGGLAIAARRGIETATADDARRRGRVFDVVVEASGAAGGRSPA